MQTKKFNIVQLIDSLAAGGAEMMAVNIANGLAEKGNSSHLCASRAEGILKNKLKQELGYLYLEKTHTFDLSALRKLNRYVKKNKIQLIHAHSNSYFLAVVLKVFYHPKIKIVWHNHTGSNMQLKGLKLWSLKLFSIFFYAAIHVNKNLMAWALHKLNGKKHFYLPNFAVLSNEQITSLKGLPKHRIVCVAGYRAEKNHLNLLRAFKQVVEKHPDWSLHLVGKGYEDAYHHQINNFISENRLEQSVFQYGVCTDIGNILSQCEIGVLSSDSEGLPISLLEYGLAGLAVVVTNVGECANVLENGKKGLIVQPNNSEELAEKILLLVEDKEIRNTFGKSLLHQVDINYSKNSFLKKLKKIY